MSKENLFDEVSRILASSISRRRAFRLIIGAVAGGATATVLEPKAVALGSVACNSEDICNAVFGCTENASCTGFTKGVCVCDNPYTCVDGLCVCSDPFTLQGGKCVCPSGTTSCPAKNPTTCCGDGTPVCSQGHCCATGQVWVASMCCPAGAKAVCMGTCCKAACNAQGGCDNPCNNTKISYNGLPSGANSQVQVVMQNNVVGLATVDTTPTSRNCTIAPNMPMSVDGTKNPVSLTATKIDESQPGWVDLLVTDAQGNGCIKDPIFTTLKLSTGRWVMQTFQNNPSTDHYLTVTNGARGLTRVEVIVNGRLHATIPLKPNEVSNLNLEAVMNKTENTVSFFGIGNLGAAASIMLVDTAPASVTGFPLRFPEPGTVHRNAPIWGRLTGITEENSESHAVDAVSQIVRINFNGALHSSAALDPSIFTVKINGRPAVVETVKAQATKAGSLDLSLQLSQGTLHSGDTVDVYWERLLDQNQRPISGHVPLVAQ
jgi:hypothetical protein